MLTLGLIRHGTTKWNLQKRMQGQKDLPLASIGRAQAQLLAVRLATESHWDGILSSDLIRARETAELIAKQTQIPLLGTDQRLRERSFGQLEGTTEEERVERFGEYWRALELGVENDASLLARWDSFLHDMQQQYSSKRLLVVSHGGYIVPIIERLLGHELTEHLSNTSLTVLQQTDNGWTLSLVNCTMHLQQLDMH